MPDDSRLDEWELLDAFEVDSWEVKPVEWVVRELIPKGGIGFMSGQPKLGKSLITLDLCLSMITPRTSGFKWLGRFDCSPAPTLIVAREDPSWRIAERLIDIRQSHGGHSCLPSFLHILSRDRMKPPFNMLDPQHIDRLKARIEKHNIQFLILDVFNRMHPGVDENSAHEMGRVLHVLEKLNREFDLTIMALDHNRKPALDQDRSKRPDPFDVRGSGAKYGIADYMICLGKTKQERRLRIYAESKDADRELDFMVDVSAKGSAVPKFRWAGDAAQLARDRKSLGIKNREKVLSAVGDEWITRAKIQLETDLCKTTVNDHLKVLIAAGEVEEGGSQKNRRFRRVRPTGSENGGRSVD